MVLLKNIKKCINILDGCARGVDYKRNTPQNHLKPESYPSSSIYSQFVFVMLTNGNDPLAGSPTETLLRLLLPPDDQVWSILWHSSRQ